MIDPLDMMFDAQRLIEDLSNITKGVAIGSDNQISLSNTTSDENLFDGVGSISNRLVQEDFIHLIGRVKGTYTEEVIKTVGWTHGRVRYMFMKPKSCYSMHVDRTKYRYHIPIITNDQCFAVYKNHGCISMPDVGRVYRMRVDEPHSAINGGRETRVHILFDVLEHLA